MDTLICHDSTIIKKLKIVIKNIIYIDIDKVNLFVFRLDESDWILKVIDG